MTVPTPPPMNSPWETHATRWQKVGCPLRPALQDIRKFQGTLTQFAHGRERVQALLLGITAELTGLDWPRNTALVAVDYSPAMMQRHWSPPAAIPSLPVLGRWERMPLRREAVDFVIADGSLSILPNAATLADVVRHLAAVVRKAGCMALRCFVRPETPERPEQVFAAMRRGEIGSFDVLKWRLLMSLHDSSSEGVPLHTVYRTFRDVVPDTAQLARQLRWPVESIDTIESYRSASGRYFFPTLAQLRSLLSEHFAESSCRQPDYELGECCPMLVLSRR